MSWELLEGDVRAMVETIPDSTVQVIVTSPPYWSQRTYGTTPQIWGGERDHCHRFDAASTCKCGAWRGELGHESDPDLFVAHLVEVFRAARRVLRPDGLLFVNMGDCFAASGQSGKVGRSTLDGSQRRQKASYRRDKAPTGGLSHRGAAGLKEKDLVGVPARLQLALQRDGWYFRQRIVWAKGISGQRQWVDQAIAAIRAEAARMQCDVGMTDRFVDVIARLELAAGSSMPESVKDRPTTSHEDVLMFSKSDSYFWDREAVKEPNMASSIARASRQGLPNVDRVSSSVHAASGRDRGEGMPVLESSGRNLRSVWQINPGGPRGEDHYAAFPVELPSLCIKAATPEVGVCAWCLTPWVRVVVKGDPDRARQSACGGDSEGLYLGQSSKDHKGAGVQDASDVKRRILAGMVETRTVAWRPACLCDGRGWTRGGEPRRLSRRLGRARRINARLKKFARVAACSPTVPARVLDLFGGTGTTGIAAERLGRDSILIEVVPKYAGIARRLLGQTLPLFSVPAAEAVEVGV